MHPGKGLELTTQPRPGKATFEVIREISPMVVLMVYFTEVRFFNQPAHELGGKMKGKYDGHLKLRLHQIVWETGTSLLRQKPSAHSHPWGSATVVGGGLTCESCHREIAGKVTTTKCWKWAVGTKSWARLTGDGTDVAEQTGLIRMWLRYARRTAKQAPTMAAICTQFVAQCAFDRSDVRTPARPADGVGCFGRYDTAPLHSLVLSHRRPDTQLRGIRP
jgi:hypothetical protein